MSCTSNNISLGDDSVLEQNTSHYYDYLIGTNLQQCEIMHEDPRSLKHVKVFQNIHKSLGHIGSRKMKELHKRAQIFWSVINKNIENIVGNCDGCRLRKRSVEKSTTRKHISASFPLKRS